MRLLLRSFGGLFDVFLDYCLELFGIVRVVPVEEGFLGMDFGDLFANVLCDLKGELDEGKRLDYFLLVDGSTCCLSLYKSESLSKWIIKYSGFGERGVLIEDVSISEVLEFLRGLAHQRSVNFLKQEFAIRKQSFKEGLLNERLGFVAS